MKNILIYLPHQTVAMSATLINDLCWVATAHAARAQQCDIDPSQFVQRVSADGNPIKCFTGQQLPVDISLNSSLTVDAIFLCAFWGAPQLILQQNQALIEWLPSLQEQETPIIGISNAAFFMAEAGLLDNKVATLYPPSAPTFEHRYPNVNLRTERAITDAGNLYCANGIASGCDLTVSIIEMLYGPEVARQISQEFLLGFNRNYALGNVEFDGQKYHKDRQILTAQQWLERNFPEDVSLENVAADLGMSPRNFSRRFKQATGDSPGSYLLRVRMEAAKDLLRGSALTVSEVAYRCGYTDVS